ncbi:MAG TPA: XRE family transcriptional regulator [Clostridia bacterium]|nr:XRE family transcriptional regulator [Clostridia bacterium]
MNTNMLRAKMALFGDTGGVLSRALGISQQRFSAKINDKNAEFTQGEIQLIKDRYDLTAEEVDEIFFNKKVS